MGGSAWGDPIITEGTEQAYQEPVIDDWLVGVLQNPRNREVLRKLEMCLDNFVSNSSLERMDVPPKSAFQRKIVHHVAARYNLDNRLVASGAQSGGDETRALVLIKTSSTSVPRVRLSDIDPATLRDRVASKAQDDASKRPKCIRRRESDAASSVGNNIRKKNSALGTIRGVTEEEYAKARARIFQSSDSGGDESSEAGADEELRPAPVNKPHQPLPPVEGSRGFARRIRQMDLGIQPTSSSKSVSDAAGDSSGAEPEKPTPPHPTLFSNTWETVQSSARDRDMQRMEAAAGASKPRATWRDDMYDPDFDRSYQRWIDPLQYLSIQDREPSRYVSMSQQQELMYSSSGAFLPSGMMGPSPFGGGWMPEQHSSVPHQLEETAQGQRMYYQGEEQDMQGFVSQRDNFPVGQEALSRVSVNAAVPKQNSRAVNYHSYGSREPLDQAAHQPHLVDHNQRKQTKGVRSLDSAEYGNISEFPPLGRSSAPSRPEAKTGAGFAWEGRV
mmetsp:Transcript_473/g.1629  ORF Transcript_473/g.1629 Transcript_473/m.1629 type:complete len:501 (-) Transcript_473:72-1574(-)|eukprot:CAMPEP_0198722626 /NCGR_PEP_ID=MMETSP1475-20131203/282_1 /TAXON_ID= ORGANISM="Unidentified sp., Strain CCMP1999" /NCGR_SAMPLE_ID=MMETSP1475 /ASSEMBLY_ACC=CAM_ASM_001111 /LENGTH=500 /DNA_ID=CAMNT_0044483537 /DNA_START=441 /DNA_END=1943 /DNA_ORIENTATION=-